MGYKTLEETTDSLRSNLSAFVCIGRPKGSPCEEALENECKIGALRLLAEDNANLTIQDHWDILTLLLCHACQKKYNQRNGIRDHWGFDTPETNPTGKRYRSPYSLHSQSPESHRRRSSALRLAASGDLSTSRGRSSERRTPPSPTEAALTRRSARHGPLHPSRSTQTSNSDTIIADLETEDGQRITEDAYSEAAPGQLSRMTPAIRVSEGHSFSAGETSTWAPWKLRSEVLELLWEELPDPESKGYIYAVEVVDTPYVKIGITTRKVCKRLAEIQNTHGTKLRVGGVKFEGDIPWLQLCRLERVVHAHLAFFQRDLTVQKATGRRTHKEYFEVDLATAMETIRMMLKTMQSIGLEPGTAINKSIKSSVQDAIRDIDTPPAGVSSDDRDWWKTINVNHKRSLDIWSMAFKLPNGGFKKSRVDKAVSSLIVAALALCFLYSLHLPYWVKNVIAVFLLTAGALYSMDTRSSDGCITWVVNCSKAMPCFIASLKGLKRLMV